MEICKATLEDYKNEAMALLNDRGIYDYVRKYASEFLEENAYSSTDNTSNINLEMFSMNYGFESYVELFFVPCGINKSSSAYDLPDDVISEILSLNFYKFGNRWVAKKGNYKRCSSYDTFHFSKFNEFYQLISGLCKRKKYEVSIICFYLMTESISIIASESTYFYKNSIPNSVFEKSCLSEVVLYFINLYKIQDNNSLNRYLPLLICYIYTHRLWEYNDIQVIIHDCFSIGKEIIKKNSDVNSFAYNNDANTFNMALENYFIQLKEDQKEEEQKRIQLYIDEIINQAKAVLSDLNVEKAINRLIASISVEKLLTIQGYDICRGLFIQNTTLFNLMYPNEEICGNGLSELSDLKAILLKRYKFPEKYSTEITWCVFNYCIIKKYSRKWLEICVTGEIGERTLENYLSDCFNDDMISLDDEERIALFCFYLASLEESESISSHLFLFQPTILEYNKILKLLANYKEHNRMTTLENKLFGNVSDSSDKVYYTIDDIDLMTGIEFENFIKKLFIAMGYSADTTKASGDQGIDVIVEKNGIKFGIQAKCYSGTVGNSAVQEAVAGRLYYGLDKVIVITNSRFTKAAIKLAASNGAVLWDRSILAEKLIYVN